MRLASIAITSGPYREEGEVSVVRHVGHLQVLQDHGAVAVGLHHVQVVVIFSTKKV